MKLIEGVYILALVACFAGNCACISSGTSVNNIAGYEYQAAVLCPVIMCSGAIVSTKNVVTTATCINYLSSSDVKVHVGSVTYYSGGYTLNVANILKHSSFNPSTYDNNIAILTVETPFDFGSGTVQMIQLATSVPPTNDYLTVTAYGAINSDLVLPDVLQKAFLKKYSPADCQVKKSNKLTASMFCAGDPTGKKDTCPADQGAPAVYLGKLVGIYSWGAGCGLANPSPSSPVFTSVSVPTVYNWIKANIITQ